MGESQTGLEKDPARGFQHGERCCWEMGKILLSMGALAKDSGPPKLGTWVSKQPFDHSSQWSRRLRSAVRVHHPVWLVRTNDQQTRRASRRRESKVRPGADSRRFAPPSPRFAPPSRRGPARPLFLFHTGSRTLFAGLPATQACVNQV